MLPKTLKRNLILFLVVLTASSAAGQNGLPNPMFDGRITFSAILAGVNEAPNPVTTNASGVAGFQLSQGMDTLWIMAQVNGLSGPITGAHIHSGVPGQAGGVILDLNQYRKGNKISGFVTGGALNSNLITEMISGRTYINVHTNANPNGEIRGNIMLESDYALHAEMSGANEVPAVTGSTSHGITVASVSQDKSMIHLHTVFTNLSSSITGAHLHIGKAGTNGVVIVNLMPYLSGNQIHGSFRITQLGSRVDSLLMGDVYINVHTSNNMGGEIRGQLMPSKGLAFMTILNGAAERPPVVSLGFGLSYVEINPAMDTLTVHVVYDSLTSTATDAHFHNATRDSSGGVEIALKNLMTANAIHGTIVSFDKAVLRKMLAGNIYINIHTSIYTGGEIRGQMLPFARQGFVFDLCKGQETGTVTATSGSGIGVVSISPMLTDVHYLIAIDSLSGPATTQHFHSGVMGKSGNPIFGLNSFSNGVSMGFWSDTTTLTDSIVRIFQSEGMYVNVHTTANAGGEIRGQIRNGAECERLVGIEPENRFYSNIVVYPVPFRNSMTVEIDALKNENVVLKLIDGQGKIVLINNASLHAGKNLIPVSIDAARPGLYMLQLTDRKGKIASQRVIRY
jgi:hypothetical protein